MEASRIDAAARALAGRMGSRRAALSWASLGALAATFGRSGSSADARLQPAATPIMSDSPTPTATNTIAPTASSTATATASPTRTPTRAPTATATTVVAATAQLRVETTCQHDELANRSTCVCACVAPAGSPKVTSVALASDGVRADVIGGDALLTPPSPTLDALSFTASDGEATLSLVLNGKVAAQGETTYWCETDAGAVQVTGPALVRAPEEVPAKTGVIVVRARRCNLTGPAPAGYDWHGQCSQPAAGALFILSPASGAHTQDGGASRVAGPDGRAAFGPVAPGSYKLSQAGSMWRHAESDSVDAEGRVTVRPESRATVWIFD